MTATSRANKIRTKLSKSNRSKLQYMAITDLSILTVRSAHGPEKNIRLKADPASREVQDRRVIYVVKQDFAGFC